MNRSVSFGKKVYPDFTREVHVGETFFTNLKPLNRGWDFGYHSPAVVFTQFDSQDRMIVLAEIQGVDMTTHKFAEKVQKYTNTYFRDAKCLDWGDPSGNRKQSNGKTDIEILRGSPFKIYCRSKKSTIHDGIELLTELIQIRPDNLPGILIDPSCMRLIEGFTGGYSYKTPKGATDTYKEEPDKDGHFDHVQDALRYLVVNTIDMSTLNPKRQIVWNKAKAFRPGLDDITDMMGPKRNEFKDDGYGYGVRDA